VSLHQSQELFLKRQLSTVRLLWLIFGRDGIGDRVSIISL